MNKLHDHALGATRNPIVINWHVTEACNYHCGYCYAKWDRLSRTDLIRDLSATKALLESLYSHFGASTGEPRPRLNFAGGEPLLYAEHLLSTMRLARAIGFDVSLISNGSRLDSSTMLEMAPELSMLGLSIDATASGILTAIGREDRRGRQLDMRKLMTTVALGRRVNPALQLKINTVVCSSNSREDLSWLIRDLAPLRWKVLRALPVINRELQVSDAEFADFVRRHQSLADLMVIEDHEDMLGSYVMVDPSGRFFQNRAGTFGYDYSPPILDLGAEQAFARIGWSAMKFDARYAPPVVKHRA